MVRFMWTDARITQILTDREAGKSVEDTAKAVGCSITQLVSKLARLKSGVNATPESPEYKMWKCSKCGERVRILKINFICTPCKQGVDWRSGGLI